jgi:hypothetical protein
MIIESLRLIEDDLKIFVQNKYNLFLLPLNTIFTWSYSLNRFESVIISGKLDVRNFDSK